MNGNIFCGVLAYRARVDAIVVDLFWKTTNNFAASKTLKLCKVADRDAGVIKLNKCL
jgi:hypothetical protein